MKKLFSILLCVFTLSIVAQNGKTFPTIIGETLDGKAISLPIKNNKKTIVAWVFSRSAEDELKKWLNPLYSTFMDKPKGKPAFGQTVYDVNFIFIPLIGGLKKVREDFKATTDKGFWSYIMDTDKFDMKLQADLLGIKDKSIPYIMVLDKNGKIIDTQSGNYSEDKEEKIEEAAGE
ncbi:MAG: hypothetical protein LCH32_12500 [Bacteroidetes bacterium]|jgi:hypothetical protein|nr:hypothetical protein [Bacteroidota bacterium]